MLASNTSSLSIGELAAVLEDPTRLLGMHFFNPVPASRLVELVVGSQTADAVRDRAQAWVRALGKTDVVVRDSPGLATSRLGVLRDKVARGELGRKTGQGFYRWDGAESGLARHKNFLRGASASHAGTLP